MTPHHDLVLLRHGKSDWSVPVSDSERPLSARGVRQATEAGRWIGEHFSVDLALVSVARRARQTWDLASAELRHSPVRRNTERLYTFDGREVLQVVRALPDEVRTVVLVGHNPAFEETVELLTGQSVELKTSAVAVVRLASWAATGELVTYGRPPSW